MSDENIKKEIEEMIKLISKTAAITDIRMVCQPWAYSTIQKIMDVMKYNNVELYAAPRESLPENVIVAIIDDTYERW